MQQAGVAQALERGLRALRERVVLRELPVWFTQMDFLHARSNADPWAAGEYVHELRAAERQLRLRASGRAAWCRRWELQDPSEEIPALPAWAADAEESQKCMVVALARLALGSAIEAAFAEEALDRCAPGARTSDCDNASGRLYQDAFLVAVWTSAHAQYVSCVQSGVEEPPVPGLQSVPNAAAEFDLSDLFARRFCARLCPKPAMPLLQILMRSTYVPTGLEPYLPFDSAHALNSPSTLPPLLVPLPLPGIRARAAGTRCSTPPCRRAWRHAR